MATPPDLTGEYTVTGLYDGGELYLKKFRVDTFPFSLKSICSESHCPEGSRACICEKCITFKSVLGAHGRAQPVKTVPPQITNSVLTCERAFGTTFALVVLPGIGVSSVRIFSSSSVRVGSATQLV